MSLPLKLLETKINVGIENSYHMSALSEVTVMPQMRKPRTAEVYVFVCVFAAFGSRQQNFPENTNQTCTSLKESSHFFKFIEPVKLWKKKVGLAWDKGIRVALH